MPSAGQLNAAIDLRATELGWLAVAVSNGRMLSVAYGHKTPRAAERALDEKRLPKTDCDRVSASDDELAAKWAGLIENYCRGEGDQLREILLADDHLTSFAREVTHRCRQIPPGKTLSYGELADACGRPRAARAVGSVMARNPWPLVVPCHRVLGANGALGGYSAPQGLAMKRRLLAMEGAG